MKSRRLIASPRGSGQGIVTAQTRLVKMSALGHKRTYAVHKHVRFTTNSDRESEFPQTVMSANFDSRAILITVLSVGLTFAARELRETMHLIKGSFRTYASASVLEQESAAILSDNRVPSVPARLLGPG